MELNKQYLAKMRFREDTAENWKIANPVLSSAEPGFELNTGLFKIGDGKTSWNELEYVIPKSTINEVPASDKYYVRTKNADAPTGHWVELPQSLEDAPNDGNIYCRSNNTWIAVNHASYAKKFVRDSKTYDLEDVYDAIPVKSELTLNDLYKANFDNELDMNIIYASHDGSLHKVFGKKIRLSITATANTTQQTTLVQDVGDILYVSGLYQLGNGESCYLPDGKANIIYLPSTRTMALRTTSSFDRTNAEAELICIYTKILN